MILLTTIVMALTELALVAFIGSFVALVIGIGTVTWKTVMVTGLIFAVGCVLSFTSFIRAISDG